MPRPATASQHITISTRSVDSTQVRPPLNTQSKDLPKAGPGTSRPPLPRTPSAALLERIALHNQQISSNMEAPTSKHPSSLASPIRLAPPYTTTMIPPHLVRGHGHPTPPSGQYPRPSQYNPRCQPRPGALPKPSPLSNHDPNSTLTPTSRRLNSTLPIVKPMPIKLVGHTSNVTPARRPQVPGPSPPIVISPLKVMFDNASRGIHSELSYLQASCTALINRERKEKELLRAHYFQMKRERDAARDRLKVLEQASAPSPPTDQPPIKQDTNASFLQIKSILKKRRRDEFEATASSSASSRSSSPPSPRTPSPTSELQYVFLPPIRSDSFELMYSDPAESPHRVLSSPPPPPISARKMVFLSPPLSAPGTFRTSSVSPTPVRTTGSSLGPARPTRKACSNPPSPNPILPSSPFLRPALSRVSRLNAPEKELSPVDFAPSDEPLPPIKRRRTPNRSKDGPSSEQSLFSTSGMSGERVLYIKDEPLDAEDSHMTELGLGEGDMELESDFEGSEAGSEREVEKSVMSNNSSSSTPPRPVTSTSSLTNIFPSAQPLRQMCSNYVRSSQAGQRVDISGL